MFPAWPGTCGLPVHRRQFVERRGRPGRGHARASFHGAGTASRGAQGNRPAIELRAGSGVARTVDRGPLAAYVPPSPKARKLGPKDRIMKVVNSLKSAKGRHKDCRIVRRKGRVYIINKTNPRYKARQG